MYRAVYIRRRRYANLAYRIRSRLEVVIVAASNDHIINLEDHSTELGSEEELLAFRDKRINDEVLLHV